MSKTTPVQTLRNMTCDELADHVSMGGNLPASAYRHLATLVEDINHTAENRAAGNDRTLDTVEDLTGRPLAGWLPPEEDV